MLRLGNGVVWSVFLSMIKFLLNFDVFKIE